MRWNIFGLFLAALLLIPTTAIAGHAVHLTTRRDTIPVPAHDSQVCWVWENCQLLEGISIVSYNITAAMDKAERRMAEHGDAWSVIAEFWNNGYTFPVTTMLLCQYDADHDIITCDHAYWNGIRNGIQTTVSKDAEHMRVILMEGAAADSYLRLVAMSD